MNMMNKCAKFHKDSVSGKKVKFNLPNAIECSETADFVYCIAGNFRHEFNFVAFVKAIFD